MDLIKKLAYTIDICEIKLLSQLNIFEQYEP